MQNPAMMATQKKYAFVILICVSVYILALLALVTSKPLVSDVSITVERNINTLHGPTAILQLNNRGKTTVRVDPYCTIYWTNQSGISTYKFFRHDLGYAILHPGQSNFVTVPSPLDAKVWQTSFSYQIRPSFLKRIENRIKFWMPGQWVPDNSFVGLFGPTITNLASNAVDAPSLERPTKGLH